MGVTRYVLPFSSITAIILGIAYGKDEVLVRSCPQDKSSWDTAARRKECKPEGGQNYEYHCVKNERQELVETCMVAQWIEKGVCPILFDSGSFGAENCTLRTFLGPCPTRIYHSNEMYKFPLCFASITITTTTTAQLIPTSTTKNVTGAGSMNVTTLKPNHPRDKTRETIIGILLLLLIVIAAIIAYLIINRKKLRSPSNSCTDIEQGSRIEESMTELLLHSSAKSVQPERKIVQLAAYAKGKQILTKNGILVITGRVGSGKSTAMNRIIELLNDDLYDEKKWKVKEALSWNKELQYEGQIMITWDDCFGQFVTYPIKKEKTRQRIEELVKWVKVDVQNRKLVLTMSETVFKKFNVVDLLEVEEKDFKLCLDGLSQDEKSSLVAATSEYISKFSELKDDTWNELKKKLQELISKEDESVKISSSLGWPLICRLATIPYIAYDFAAFVEDPFTCVQSLFDDLNSTNQNLLLYCAMIGVSFKVTDPEFLRKFKEEIEKNKKQNENDKEEADIVGMLNSGDAIIKKLSSELNRDPPSAYSHYFLKTGKEDFQLCHNIFQLWLLCHFYKQFPELTVQYLDFDLLLELLRPTYHTNEFYEEEIAQICGFDDKDEDAASEDNNKNKKWRFILERNMYDLFLGRVGTEDDKSLIENKQNSDLNHPLLDDSTFKTNLLSHRKVMQYKFVLLNYV